MHSLSVAPHTVVLSDRPTTLSNVLTTDQKGAAAELAIAYLAVELGVGVFKPLTDGERYDLIFDLRPRLVRVQCKTAVLSGSVLKVACYSSRRGPEGFIKRCYDATEVDAIAADSPDLGRVLLPPAGRDTREKPCPATPPAVPEQSA